MSIFNVIRERVECLSYIEPILQKAGVLYSILFIHILLSIDAFFLTAAPAWMDLAHESTTIKVATCAARGSAAVINLNAALIILLGCRFFLTLLRQSWVSQFVPFDKAMPAFHSFVGNSLGGATVVHIVGHIVRFCLRDQEWGGILGTASLTATGTAALVIFSCMRLTSLPNFRRTFFEYFYVMHITGALLFYILLIFHGSHKKTLTSWMYIIGPNCLYIIDVCLRRLSQQTTEALSGHEELNIKSEDILCLRLPRSFGFRAGQYCDVKVPSISNTQWHPFTIASSPHEKEMRFYIKALGNWTNKLKRLLEEQTESEKVIVNIRGPYGAPAQHVGQYNHIVLISGGIGATPMVSIAKDAHNWILNYCHNGRYHQVYNPNFDFDAHALGWSPVQPSPNPMYLPDCSGAPSLSYSAEFQEKPSSRNAEEGPSGTHEHNVDLGLGDGETGESIIVDRFSRVQSFVNAALLIFNSSTANWFVIWLTLIRWTLLVVGLESLQVSFSKRGLGLFGTHWMNIVDLIIATTVFVYSFVWFVADSSVNEDETVLPRYWAPFFENIILLSLTVSTIVTHALHFAGTGEEAIHMPKFTVFAIWPLTTFFLFRGISQRIGPRVVLSPNSRPSHAQTQSMDYIWVSKTYEEDSWVLSELQPVTDCNFVRLHRFITRQSASTDNMVMEGNTTPIDTSYSRPDWEKIFSNLVDRVPSETVIGVFFCGPDPMAEAIKQASRNAMDKSMRNAKQRNYYSRTEQERRNNAYGCAVGLVLRVENFN